MAALDGILVTLSVSPLQANCPGGTFAATATVVTLAPAAGGTFDVSIYAVGMVKDTVLDTSAANGVGGGRVKTVVSFTLKCDANCKIAGAAATSGDNPCDVYAYATDTFVGGTAKSQSGSKTLQCVTSEDGERGARGGRQSPRRRGRTAARPRKALRRHK